MKSNKVVLTLVLVLLCMTLTACLGKKSEATESPEQTNSSSIIEETENEDDSEDEGGLEVEETIEVGIEDGEEMIVG